MKSLYGAVGPQLLPEETSIRLEGGRATQWPKPKAVGHGWSRARNTKVKDAINNDDAHVFTR